MRLFPKLPAEDDKIIHILEDELHRSYRKLHVGKMRYGLLSHLVLLIIVSILVLVNLKPLTHFYSGIAFTVLGDKISNLKLETLNLLNTDVWVLHGLGNLPSLAMLYVVIGLSVLVWIIMKSIKSLPLPVVLSIKSLCAINIVSCVYFLIWKDKFPYDLNNFSRLYISAEIGMWIAIPFMLVFALLPIPVSIFYKSMLVLFTDAYIYFLGIFRYALLIYILAKFSYLWMALLYFTAVVFFDFACMIAFYSYFISLVTPNIIRQRGIWRWLYSS